jgi:pimeloyl-ACP methyl ester carboxylesterase
LIAPLSKLLDWSAIQFAASRMPRADGQNPRLEEARQFLAGPDFIPAESESARVEWDAGKPGRFRFPTPRPGRFAENNIVYGRLYGCQARWQERPAIVLLHGWNDLINHRVRFPFMARRCNRAGFNAVTLTLPYHFQRRPRALGAWSNFLCPDVSRTAAAAAQAIAEMRALTGWLLREGCPSVALWGVSLGAWLAGLALCRDARWAAAVLTAPVVRLDRVIEELAFCRSIREGLQGRRIEVEMLNLTAARPALRPENILLIEGTHDLFMPPETIEELWQVWGRPDLWRLRHGHVGIVGAPGLTGRVLRWLAPRLEAGGRIAENRP